MMDVTLRESQEGMRELCQQLFFRQSFLGDYLTCPHMSMYRWIYGIEEEQPFFAAVLGTAGHEVIFQMHQNRKFNYDYLTLLDMFCQAFEKQIAKMAHLPRLGKGFDTWQQQLAECAPDYVAMLEGYQEDEKNQSFFSLLHEQAFVLEVKVPQYEKPLLFTGQMDQVGVYEDGTFALRDIKFRDNAYRPSRTEFDLNIQMTVYAAALRYGQPVCEACRPRYEEVEFMGRKELVYEGPCLKCSEMIGKPNAWPRRFAEQCELIWMRDYERYKKDEYSKEITDKSLPKVKSATTNRKVFATVPNPKWINGYKAGDYKGPRFIPTYRKPDMLLTLMEDVVQLCEEIRSGVFYRNPGDHCNNWCKFKEKCLAGMKMRASEVDLAAVHSYGTEDPF